MKKHNVGDKQYVPHIVQEGARFHVTSYHNSKHGAYIRCSEPNCIENKRFDQMKVVGSTSIANYTEEKPITILK